MAFAAWISKHNLMAVSPSQLVGTFRLFEQHTSDTLPASLDLESLNLMVEWLKQWRPELAPEGGAVPPDHLTGGEL